MKAVSVRTRHIEDYNNERPYVRIELNSGEVHYISHDNILGDDLEVYKCETIWVPLWWARSRGISLKKKGWYDEETGLIKQRIEVKKHVPKPIKAKQKIKIDNDLLK